MGASIEPTDQELILRVKAGDPTGLDAFFVRHHGRVFAFLARWLGDSHAAEDLTQETFMRVLQHGDSAPTHADLLPWLLRIARNLGVDRYRRDRLLTDASETTEPTDPGPLPLARLASAEREAQLTIALGAIAPSHREVLLLRAVEGLDHREIGSILGCSEGAVRVRVHRATAALRHAWFTRFGGLDD